MVGGGGAGSGENARVSSEEARKLTTHPAPTPTPTPPPRPCAVQIATWVKRTFALRPALTRIRCARAPAACVGGGGVGWGG